MSAYSLKFEVKLHSEVRQDGAADEDAHISPVVRRDIQNLVHEQGAGDLVVVDLLGGLEVDVHTERDSEIDGHRRGIFPDHLRQDSVRGGFVRERVALQILVDVGYRAGVFRRVLASGEPLALERGREDHPKLRDLGVEHKVRVEHLAQETVRVLVVADLRIGLAGHDHRRPVICRLAVAVPRSEPGAADGDLGPYRADSRSGQGELNAFLEGAAAVRVE